MRTLTLIFTLSSLLSLGQELANVPADSLEQLLKTSKGTRRVKILNLLFRSYINQDPVRATGYTKEALSLAMEFEDASGIAASYNNLGVAYKNQGAFEKALENYLTADKVYEKSGNKEGRAATHNNIGTIYSLKKDFERSKKYFEESAKAFTELGDTTRMIGTLNNLGNVYSDMGRYSEALEYFNQSLTLAEKLKLKPIDPLVNIGNMYIRLNQPQKAKEYLTKAVSLAEEINDQLTLMTVRASLANAAIASADYREAEKNLLDALQVCRKLQALYMEPQILKSLAETLARQNRMSEAYQYMQNYDRAREKIFSEESSRRIAQMEMVIEIQEKEKQIEALKKEEELKSIELQRTRLAVTVAIISILAIALGINAFLQKKKKKR
ncbi:MAG: tetratricopeptide repeat protein [Cyclobacteriaceae bacterium]